MKRHISLPEGRIAAADRYWEGAEEIVLRIVLQSPNLFAENARVRQNGQHTVSYARYQHQLRQIRRREARRERLRILIKHLRADAELFRRDAASYGWPFHRYEAGLHEGRAREAEEAASCIEFALERESDNASS